MTVLRNARRGRRYRLTLLSAVLFSALAQAHGPDGKPPRPPKEAFDACAGMAVNDACSMTMPDGNTLDGACQLAPASKGAATQATSAATEQVLACRPEHMPPPPDEAAPESEQE